MPGPRRPEDSYPTDLAGVNFTNGTGDTHISIPAGFTGWAYYSIAPEDQIPWWEGTTMTADELSGVTQMRFDIRYTDATCMQYLIIDDILTCYFVLKVCNFIKDIVYVFFLLNQYIKLFSLF